MRCFALLSSCLPVGSGSFASCRYDFFDMIREIYPVAPKNGNRVVGSTLNREHGWLLGAASDGWILRDFGALRSF